MFLMPKCDYNQLTDKNKCINAWKATYATKIQFAQAGIAALSRSTAKNKHTAEIEDVEIKADNY